MLDGGAAIVSNQRVSGCFFDVASFFVQCQSRSNLFLNYFHYSCKLFVPSRHVILICFHIFRLSLLLTKVTDGLGTLPLMMYMSETALAPHLVTVTLSSLASVLGNNRKQMILIGSQDKVLLQVISLDQKRITLLVQALVSLMYAYTYALRK